MAERLLNELNDASVYERQCESVFGWRSAWLYKLLCTPETGRPFAYTRMVDTALDESELAKVAAELLAEASEKLGRELLLKPDEAQP